jgi:hypothetical protein
MHMSMVDMHMAIMLWVAFTNERLAADRRLRQAHRDVTYLTHAMFERFVSHAGTIGLHRCTPDIGQVEVGPAAT